MTDILSLDEGYSTTRLLTQEKPQIINTPEDKFETVLFLPEGENRKGEGGLRTKGYFKRSFDDKPLISIITVVFNGEKYLEETIQSVINQTYSNVEYIIIDGGSTDGTLDIIKKYEDKIDYWVSEKDKGIYDAMNKGIKLSRGELIGIINADDYYEIDVLEKVVSIYTKDSEVIYGDLRFIESESINFIAKAPIKLEGMLKRMVIFHPSTFVTKEVYLKYGMYKDTFKIAADYEFLLRLYCNKIKFFKVDGVFANFRDGGISSSFTWTNLKENIRARKENRISSIIFKELLVFIYFRLKGLFG